MANRLILAFDPGGTSGVCAALHLTERNFKVLNCFEVDWKDRFNIYYLLAKYQKYIGTIIIEEYRLYGDQNSLRSQIGSVIPSAQVIGIIEVSAHILQLDHTIKYQKPSNIHTKNKAAFSVDPEHKHHIIGSTHKLDAYLHAKFFILTNRKRLELLQ